MSRPRLVQGIAATGPCAQAGVQAHAATRSLQRRQAQRASNAHAEDGAPLCAVVLDAAYERLHLLSRPPRLAPTAAAAKLLRTNEATGVATATGAMWPPARSRKVCPPKLRSTGVAETSAPDERPTVIVALERRGEAFARASAKAATR